jgi:hypothetical protein
MWALTMKTYLVAPALVVVLAFVAVIPAIADGIGLEMYYIPSQYYVGYWQSGGGPDVCAQAPGVPDPCGSVSSIQVFIETPGVNFFPGTTPQNEGGTVTAGGNGNEIAGWSQQTVSPQYLFMSGPTYSGILDAFLFVQGNQNFAFDYYFNESSGQVIAGSGIYGQGPCYPINGNECYSLGGSLINPAEVPEPRSWTLVGASGLLSLCSIRKRRRGARKQT